MKEQKVSNKLKIQSKLSLGLLKQMSNSFALKSPMENRGMQQQQSISEHSRLAKLDGDLQIVYDIFKAVDSKTFADFNSLFIFGKEMKIWRKGNIKPVVVFVDQNIPNLMWISTKTKAFLFDIAYASIEESDLQFQLVSQAKHYFILHYFQENIPFLFENHQEVIKYKLLVKSGLFQYQKLKPNYPPYLSKLIKHYTESQLLQDSKRTKSVNGILNISEKLVGKDRREANTSLIHSLVSQKYQVKQHQFYDQVLNDDEVMQFFKIACCNQNLKAIFQNYAKIAMNSQSQFTTPLMNMEQLKKFLMAEQKQSLFVADTICVSLSKDFISFYDFCVYLCNRQYNYLAYTPQIDQNLPLTDYYCYSSHNTYLSGNQITSDSKVQRYIEDLSSGLKCLEIDVHNSGDELIVTHAAKGLHLSKQVKFEDVIKQISIYCRMNQHFHPIILSIENRTKKQSHYTMANIFRKYLGQFLFILDQQYKGNTDLKCKTLAQHRGRIIIKGDSKISDLLLLARKPTKVSNSLAIELKVKPPITSYSNSQFNFRFNKFHSTVKTYEQRKDNFSDQFPYTLYLPIDQMAKVTGLFKCQQGLNNENSVGYESTSITNKKLLSIEIAKCKQYTIKSFLRIYPVASQISSGNYNPIPALQRGAQIIALNTQTRDDFAWLMMSYFTAGVSEEPQLIGYIEKPLHLRSNIPPQNITKKIEISVLSTALNVKIRFFGTQQDQKRNTQNSFCFIVSQYEVAFLMFQIGQNLRDCIPLRFIRQGYRVIIGRNQHYKDCGVRILLRVKIKNVPTN